MKNKSKLLRFVIRFLPFICASIFLVSCSKSCDMDTLVVTNEAEYPVHVSINMGSTSYTAVLNTGGAVRKDYSWTDTATITATRADAWLTEARAKRSYWETELSTVPPSVDVETILAS
ncbi:MAG: hypothetical protein LWX83_16335, partial [Anaerolineae bacterium]|nr:hypothetical protein [Anaerolineae bacterium]